MKRVEIDKPKGDFVAKLLLRHRKKRNGLQYSSILLVFE
jgi:hypothetical protein